MQEIIEQAGSLGRAIAGSPQAARLRQARADLEAKKDLLDLLKDCNTSPVCNIFVK